MANARTEADVTATGGDVFAALEPQPFWRRALVGLGVAALFEA